MRFEAILITSFPNQPWEHTMKQRFPNFLLEAQQRFRSTVHDNPHFIIARHGNANPIESTTGRDDLQRQLTWRGRAQAEELGRYLRDDEFDLIITSPAPRSIHTALIIMVQSSCCSATARMHIGTRVQFYNPSSDADATELLALWRELGHTGYGAYKTKAGELFQRFKAELLRDLASIPRIKMAQSVLMSNHGLIANVIAEAILEALTEDGLDSDDSSTVRDTALNECGYLSLCKGNGISYVPFDE